MNKKILCVHQGYELYGSDRSFITSLDALRVAYPDGYISIIIPKKGPLYDYLIADGYVVKVEPIAKISKLDIKKLRVKKLIKPFISISRIIGKVRNYDIVYVNTIVVLDYIFASYFFRTPLIVHVREIPTGALKTISKWILNTCGAFLIFNSNATQKTFGRRVRRKHSILYNGVSGYPDVKPIRTDCLRLLIIGRLIDWKGQLFALRAIARNKAKLPDDMSIRIVGSAFEDQVEYLNDLRNTVERYNMKDMVEFISFVSEPKTQYEWANVVVVPSTKPEPFGRIAIEAMSASRPVLAADHGGLSEIITHQKTGYLFEPGSEVSFCDFLLRMIKKLPQLRQMGEEGYRVYQNTFTEVRYKEHFTTLFQSITEKK